MLKLSINGYELKKTERFIMLSAYDNCEPTEEKIDLQECSLNEIRMLVFGEHPAEANQYLEEKFGIPYIELIDIGFSELMELTGLNKAEEKQMWIEFLEGK
jgi:hypothetical protein